MLSKTMLTKTIFIRNRILTKLSAKLAGALVLVVPLTAGIMSSNSAVAAANKLEEVIVTAQKREQSIQDVPIAITAFTGEDIKDLGWDSPVDIIALTPNVNGYSIFGNAFPIFWIRGIGTSDQGHGANSPVGVYANEIYHSSLAGQGFALFDLERVEVLRGPQGTLWGKNTTGGAMNFVSKMPGQEVEGNFSATFGAYNGDTPEYKFEGGVSYPLFEDELAVRLALKSLKRDDWVENVVKNGAGPQTEEGLDGVDEFAGRVTLLWTPSETFEAVTRLTIGRRDGDHVPLHFEPVDNPDSFVRHGGFVEPAGIDKVSQDRPSPETVEYENFSLHLNWSLDWGTITSITGFIHSQYNQDADVDGTPRDGLFGPFEADSEQWSQELRFASDVGENMHYILGAYYFTENMGGFNWFLTGADLGPDASAAGCCENSGFGNIEQRERESMALFASLDYDLNDKFNLTGGVRWTKDEEDWSFQQLFWIFTDSRFNDGVPFANGAVELFNSGPLNEDWSEVTGDLALSYAVSDEANVYVKYSRGYLSGNHVLPFTGANFSVVDPEEIDSYELGVKGNWLDGALQIYSAIFYYDYANIQVNRGVTTSGQAGFISIRENAAAATVQGFELDVKYQPNENWFFSLGYGFTDAEFDDFLSDNPNGTIDDFSGNAFPNVPENNWNVMASYFHPLNSGAVLELTTDWNYQDDYFVDTNFDPISKGEDRTVGNVYLRYHSPEDRWKLSLYARNVADEEYVVNRRSFSNALEGNLVVYGAPQVIGLSLDINF